MRSIDESWSFCSLRLRSELGEGVFTSWFCGLKLETIVAGRAYLSVSTRFLKSWIESHYQESLLAALEAEIGGIAALQLSVRVANTAFVPVAARPDVRPHRRGDNVQRVSPPAAVPASRRAAIRCESKDVADAITGSPLDHRLNFSKFRVGRANQLAFSAAQGVFRGGPPTANPLYIHASVGLGKTHLLQATAEAAKQRGLSVVYLTAERFMYSFVVALQAQTATPFKEALRSIDLLICDDIQFLQGKVIQAEFGHTLNALIDAGRQVVVASDRPPGDLEALDERVRSRLNGGLCVQMHPFDVPLRMDILEAKIATARLQNPQFEIAPPVLAFVARSIVSSGRDLEGAVNRLIAHSSVCGTPLTIDAAAVAIRDLIRAREPKRVMIEEIQKLVASHFSVSRADILSPRRTAVVAKPRHVAMYLAKALTLNSLPEIGRRFGGRDHTTVIHAVRKIERLWSCNSEMRDELELLKRMLQG